MQPKLYNGITPNKALKDVTSGNNGAYQSGPGWDPCTGLGTPNGQALLNLLTAAASKRAASRGEAS